MGTQSQNSEPNFLLVNRNSIFRRVETGLTAIAAGKFVVVADNADREDEGDLILAAEKATPAALAFMIRYTSGIVCVPLPGERLRELGLPLMVAENTESQGTEFTVSVDSKRGTTTGISAADRATTIRGLANPGALSDDFLRPGHIFPLRAREGGVLKRPGHTEAAVDLARLAGSRPAGVLSEIVNGDGTMMRGAALTTFAERHGLPFLAVSDLIAYRRSRERIVERTAEARLPTAHGTFQVYVYRSKLDGSEHLAIVKGEIAGRENILARVHSECFAGDLLGSTRCDCGQQFEQALSCIEQEGAGVVVYLREPRGSGRGLTSKVQAHAVEGHGYCGVEAKDELGLPVNSDNYDLGAQILGDLGLTTIRLMSNNPAHPTPLVGYDLTIVTDVPLSRRRNVLSAGHTARRGGRVRLRPNRGFPRQPAT
jgi:3,4-dihydroxy 2-butanone 4-phosphate synthase / GTP cyclohydrolase II